MGEISKIAWTRSTFNPWWGCTEIGPGCDECYAREWAARFGTKWGYGAPRRFFGEKHWNEPLKWNRKAKETGEEWRVFCASMADIFDNEVDHQQRERLWNLIETTPHLTWLLLTKRIGNAGIMLPARWRFGDGLPHNIRLGITVVNQEEADRDIDKLLHFGRSFHPWISAEPQLGPIDYSKWLDACGYYCDHDYSDGLYGHRPERPLIEQIVTGGESGNNPRPYAARWARDAIRQCREAGVACFVKQLGALHVDEIDEETRARMDLGPAAREHELMRIVLEQAKGDDPDEWPEDLRVREFPRTA